VCVCECLLLCVHVLCGVSCWCCSLHLQSTLEGQVFDVVLLDESSQMTEPTSLVSEGKPDNSAAGTEPHRMHHGHATQHALTC